MSVFVVLLSGELSIELGQIILVKFSGFLLHEVFTVMLINIKNFICLENLYVVNFMEL